MNPDLRQIQRDAAIAKLISEVRSLQKQVLSQVASVRSDAQAIVGEKRRINSIPKGEKGDKGDKGDRGPAGINGKDGKDGAPGKDGLTPTKGKDFNTKEDQEAFLIKILARIKDPKDGQDAVIDEEKIIEKIVKSLRENKVLKTSDISGLNEEISSYRNQLAMKQAGQHGGGDTVVAGTNITITSNANGTKTISATGGSGLSLETDGTPNGDQALLNLVAGTNINLTDNGTGSVTIDATDTSGITELTGGVTAGPGSGSQVATVVTNANLTGPVTSVGNATAIADNALSIAKTSGLQTALDAKAPLASPTFTGTVTLPAVSLDATPNTDNTFSGPSTNSLNAGATVAQWEAVYLDSSSTWQLTDADSVGTAGSVMVALATEAGTAGNPMRVLLPGSFARNDAWSWTIGGKVYLSTTAGALTQTAPSGTDDVIRVCGTAVNADVIFWNPSEDWSTHT